MWHEELVQVKACEAAREWAAQFKTKQEAWAACFNGRWMAWWLNVSLRKSPELLACLADVAALVPHRQGRNTEAAKVAAEMVASAMTPWSTAEWVVTVHESEARGRSRFYWEEVEVAGEAASAQVAQVIRRHYPEAP